MSRCRFLTRSLGLLLSLALVWLPPPVYALRGAQPVDAGLEEDISRELVYLPDDSYPARQKRAAKMADLFDQLSTKMVSGMDLGGPVWPGPRWTRAREILDLFLQQEMIRQSLASAGLAAGDFSLILFGDNRLPVAQQKNGLEIPPADPVDVVEWLAVYFQATREDPGFEALPALSSKAIVQEVRDRTQRRRRWRGAPEVPLLSQDLAGRLVLRSAAVLSDQPILTRGQLQLTLAVHVPVLIPLDFNRDNDRQIMLALQELDRYHALTVRKPEILPSVSTGIVQERSAGSFKNRLDFRDRMSARNIRGIADDVWSEIAHQARFPGDYEPPFRARTIGAMAAVGLGLLVGLWAFSRPGKEFPAVGVPPEPEPAAPQVQPPFPGGPLGLPVNDHLHVAPDSILRAQRRIGIRGFEERSLAFSVSNEARPLSPDQFLQFLRALEQEDKPLYRVLALDPEGWRQRLNRVYFTPGNILLRQSRVETVVLAKIREDLGHESFRRALARASEDDQDLLKAAYDRLDANPRFHSGTEKLFGGFPPYAEEIRRGIFWRTFWVWTAWPNFEDPEYGPRFSELMQQTFQVHQRADPGFGEALEIFERLKQDSIQAAEENLGQLQQVLAERKAGLEEWDEQVWDRLYQLEQWRSPEIHEEEDLLWGRILDVFEAYSVRAEPNRMGELWRVLIEAAPADADPALLKTLKAFEQRNVLPVPLPNTSSLIYDREHQQAVLVVGEDARRMELLAALKISAADQWEILSSKASLTAFDSGGDLIVGRNPTLPGDEGELFFDPPNRNSPHHLSFAPARRFAPVQRVLWIAPHESAAASKELLEQYAGALASSLHPEAKTAIADRLAPLPQDVLLAYQRARVEWYERELVPFVNAGIRVETMGDREVLLIPTASLAAADQESVDFTLHTQESVEMAAVALLPFSWAPAVQRLPDEPTALRETIAGILPNAPVPAVVALDAEKVPNLAAAIPDKHPLTFLLDSQWERVVGNGEIQRALTVLLRQPQEFLVNRIIRLTAGSVQRIRLNGVEYLALDISA